MKKKGKQKAAAGSELEAVSMNEADKEMIIEVKDNTEEETEEKIEKSAELKTAEKDAKGKREKKKKEKKPLDKAAKKKRTRIIILAVVVLLILYMIISGMVAGSAPMPVTTVAVTRGEIAQTINTSGTVTTKQSKSYFSDVDVKIGSVKASAGDAVKAGDVLIAYDSEDLEKKTELAQLKQQSGEGGYKDSVQSNNEKLGDLSEANTNLAVLDQQIADTEAYIKNLEDKIAKKKSEIELFGTQLQISLLDWQDQPDSDEYLNLQKLVQENNYELNNNEEIKGWEDELEVYNDMLADYQEYRSEMKSQKSSAEAGKMTAGAKQQLEADNQTKTIEAQDDLSALTGAGNGITAEFDGVVTEMNAVEGAAIAQGAKILELQSTQDVSVKITVTKYDLDKIALGQKTVVTIGGKEYEGEVSKINKMAEKNESGAAVVGAEITIVNPDSDVYLGVEAKVVITTAEEADAVLVPVSAVNVDMEGEFIYVVEEGILTRKPVETGISSDTMIQILSGIGENDQIVTEVTTGIEEGMAVVAVPEA